ncbi:MAG TPA: hypothetical protein DEF01_09280 [Gemmatimonadetes bacterium]|nr:hypothetical protein [Gemmatimonadota bacterium]
MSRARWSIKRISPSSVLCVSVVIMGTSGLSATTPDTLRNPNTDREVSSAERTLHITLEASLPEDDQTVDEEVTEVRLFFSDAPLMRGASIRIVNSSRKLVRSSPPQADPTDAKQLSVSIDPALSAGRYVVQWRCIADDGHVMRGDFTFEVSGS